MRVYLGSTFFRCAPILYVMTVLAIVAILEMTWKKHQYVMSGVDAIVEMSGLSSHHSYNSKQNHLHCTRNNTISAPVSSYRSHKENLSTMHELRSAGEDPIVLPKFLPDLKNPCLYDYTSTGTRRLRCLPYFYIIGMGKSGTTDFHSRISQHPLIMGNKGTFGKETNFWSWSRYGMYNKLSGRRNQTLEEYMDMFDDTSRMIDNTSLTDMITGDATPMDFWDFRSWPRIPQNFEKEDPEVLTPHLLKYIHSERPPKFLIQFREPIDRLYSDYVFLKYGKTPESFHNHSLQAIDMVNECLKNYSRRLCFFSAKLYHKLPARVHLSCYSVFLREWLDVFPRSYFLITTMDEYQADMTNVLAKVFKFLDLSPLPESKMAEIVNKARLRVTKNKTGVVLPETVKALRKFYDGCNQEAADLLSDSRFLWRDYYS